MGASLSRRSRDGIVCKCLLVRQHEVVTCVRAGARSVAEIGARCDAGTGCTGCHTALSAILEEEQARRERAAGDTAVAWPQLGLFADGLGEES